MCRIYFLSLILFLDLFLFGLSALGAPQAVSIVENNGRMAVLEVQPLKEGWTKYFYTVSFGDQIVHENVPLDLDKDSIIGIPIEKSGIYSLSIYAARENVKQEASGNDKDSGIGAKAMSFLNKGLGKAKGLVAEYQVSWAQDFFLQRHDAISLSESEQQALANQYSPIALLHDSESYLPSSLEYILNEAQTDEDLNAEVFEVNDIAFPFSEIRNILTHYGGKDLVVKTPGLEQSRMRLRQGHPDETVLYYSFFEDQTSRYLNYHFLYAFDPKTGDPNDPSAFGHIFDRESLTIVFDKNKEKPSYVVYGAHLPSQTLAILDENFDPTFEWNSGRVKLSWAKTTKRNTHPIVSIAKGSHAVYPYPGYYSVRTLGQNALTEDAGGNQFLVPRVLGSPAFQSKSFDYRPYDLRDLELGKIKSDSWNSALSFSGDLVDVKGPTNAKFPPFTARESDPTNYAGRLDIPILEPTTGVPVHIQRRLFNIELLLEKLGY